MHICGQMHGALSEGLRVGGNGYVRYNWVY